MRHTDLSQHPCSIAKAVDVVGEWWTPLILRDVAYGVRRFGEIEANLGISANVLSARLAALVEAGLLATRHYQRRPERSEYVLTEKGADLVPVLLALMQWGDRWAWPKRGPVRVVHEECGHEVRIEPRCPHCERAVAPQALRALPRPGVVLAPGPGQPGFVSGTRLRAAGSAGVPLARDDAAA
jgi:DNA-binding HxlR family transcriptional regulator